VSTNDAAGRGGNRQPIISVGAVLIAAAIAGAAGISWAAERPRRPLSATSDGDVVARFEGYTLTLRDLEKQIDAQPAPIRERLADADERKEFVAAHVKAPSPRSSARGVRST
jgi:hypothetical protein